MKILQINTIYGEKSTGRTCAEVEKALIEQGHECITAYGHGNAVDNNYTYRINTVFEYSIHNVLSRITGLEGYYSKKATKRLINFIKEYRPDVIHLRNLHGHYICLPILFEYLGKQSCPVIQNLHDCWAFTGNCAHYTAIRCNKWENKCGRCPQKREYPKSWLFDRTVKMRRDKEKWYKGIKKLSVVGVSDWILEEAKKSYLKDAERLLRIYNWINQNIFHPYGEDMKTRKKYGIPIDKFVIIGVSASWSEGSPRYEDFMEISRQISNDEVLVLIGAASASLNHEKIIHISFVDDISELAKLYSCADVYVHCSIEDTFGKVIAEAMSCGLPAIVYNSTGCPELIKNGCGYIVSPRDIEAVMEKVRLIKSEKKEKYLDESPVNVGKHFNYETNVRELINLYEEVSGKRC